MVMRSDKSLTIPRGPNLRTIDRSKSKTKREKSDMEKLNAY